MREARLTSVSSHAVQRLAQRNLSASDVHYVYRHGRLHHAGKATFVSILGLERARDQSNLLARQAAQHLEPFGQAADLLKQAAEFVVARRA